MLVLNQKQNNWPRCSNTFGGGCTSVAPSEFVWVVTFSSHMLIISDLSSRWHASSQSSSFALACTPLCFESVSSTTTTWPHTIRQTPTAFSSVECRSAEKRSVFMQHESFNLQMIFSLFCMYFTSHKFDF